MSKMQSFSRLTFFAVNGVRLRERLDYHNYFPISDLQLPYMGLIYQLNHGAQMLQTNEADYS